MSSPAARERMKDARAALYREHLLDAAERVFSESGYDQTKVQQVAAGAGVSLATLYSVFETKWELYRAVHERRTRAIHEHVRAAVETEGDLLDRMLHSIRAYVEYHLTHVSYLKMHLREQHVWSTSATLESPEQIDAWTRGLSMMSKSFELGQASGIFHADERPDLMARTTLAMHQVRLGDWVERGMVDTHEDVIRGVHRQFIRAFCTADVVRARLGVEGEGKP